MTDRYNLRVPYDTDDGKTIWRQVGVLLRADGDSFTFILDTNPFPNKPGKVVGRAYPPRDVGEDYRDKRPARDLDDKIPF